MPDLIYKTYHTMYVIDPGEIQVVEANPDAIGLKLGVVYDTKRFKQDISFHRFTCHNDSVLTITSIAGGDIDYYGDGTTLQGKNTLREQDVNAFNLSAQCTTGDMAEEGDRPVTGASKLFKNVQEKAEDAIKKVTGKEVSLDLHKSDLPDYRQNMASQASLSKIHTSTSSLSTTGELNNAKVNTSSHNDAGNSPLTSANLQANRAAPPNATPSKANNSNNNANNNMPPRAAPSPGAMSEVTMTTRMESVYEKYEQDVELIKKEKKWESEVERVKRERAERAIYERDHPEQYQDDGHYDADKNYLGNPSGVKQAPVVQQSACSVCIVS